MKMRKIPKNNPGLIFDQIAGAIRGSNTCARRMQELDQQIRDNLDEFESNLRKILEFPKVVEAPEAERLLRRVERLRELRNMCEFGSLMIEVERDMDAVWRRLPK